MTFSIGDIVFWKGIECKVVAINPDTIQANKTDEGQSLRIIDLPTAFSLPPPVTATVDTISVDGSTILSPPLSSTDIEGV